MRNEEWVWLETVLIIETLAAFWLASANGLILTRIVLAAKRQARRLAAGVLAFLCLGQALESLLFLWNVSAWTGTEVSIVALLTVRSVLLASTALLSLLLLRGLQARRRVHGDDAN